nr:hypothetical protein CFP56_36461 [Quercus suber]
MTGTFERLPKSASSPSLYEDMERKELVATARTAGRIERDCRQHSCRVRSFRPSPQSGPTGWNIIACARIVDVCMHQGRDRTTVLHLACDVVPRQSCMNRPHRPSGLEV